MRQVIALPLFAITFFAIGFSIPDSCMPNSDGAAVGQEIGFLEEFALANDREKVLKQLVPGTQTYYLYHCLHFQNTQQLDRVDEMLAPWIKRFGYTNEVNKIRNRQALLKYGDDHQATLEYLRNHLNLQFAHQRQIPQTQRDLPSTLDPQLIDIDKLTNQAMARHQNTAGFTDDGLHLLADKTLNKHQLRHLLERLKYPDYPNLVDLIIGDLKERDSRGFGRINIHNELTIKQLDELKKKYTKVADQTNFVNIYLNKLAPSEDVDWRNDVAEHQQYLDRLWSYVKNLSPSHNSLKANVLFRKLDLERSRGEHDRELFLAYLNLPRHVGYINPILLKSVRSSNHIANLEQDFNDRIQLYSVRNDEPLVRDFLHYFLVDANSAAAFQPFIETKYLDRQFATVKILSGLGDKEKWASMLTPEQYQELLKRVDLDFVATNQDRFEPADDVEIELFTKNVKTLIVKVFEINTENYYRKHNSEIDTDVNLDGLVPNFEETFKYDDEPALRVKRKFELPQLKDRGVYIVDFIAGGKSSRALIRKGRLQIVSQTTAAGQLFTVLDQNKNVVTDTSIWMAGRRYQSDKDGRILVPFSTNGGRVNAIIRHDNFSCLQTVEHVTETYKFSAAMIVDRAALTRSNSAQILIRPSLRIAGGNSVPLSLLNDPKLVLTSINQDNVASTKTFKDLKLNEDGETVCNFIVPPRLKSIQLSLTANIETVSTSKVQNVAATEEYTVNQIDMTDVIQDVHLVPVDSGYILEVLGKTGETRANQSVRLTVHVDGIEQPVTDELQSDENGRIDLGSLKNVDRIEAKLAGAVDKSWQIRTDDLQLPQTIHSLAGKTITVAAPADLTTVDATRVSLFEKRRGTIVKDWLSSVTIANGMLQIEELPAGDFELHVHHDAKTYPTDQARVVNIRVTDGKLSANVLVGDHRHLENRNQTPLQITGVSAKEKDVSIQLTNVTKSTRVHVLANRYHPAFNAFGHFAKIQDVQPWLLKPASRNSVYMEGRKIGDEYQYILDRKYAAKYPGNMLQRPSLLLNPWATKTTNNNTQDAAAGSEFGEAGNAGDGQALRNLSMIVSELSNSDFANLDFLGEKAALLANLTPDKDGKISIDRDKLGPFQHFRVIAVDNFAVVQRTANLPVSPLKPRDSRLANVLDADKHFSQRKQIEILDNKDTLLIEDIISAKFQTYDDLGDVYRLLTALNPNTKLAKFEFVLNWNDHEEEKKRDLFSKHACHELNFFIMKKDREFFDSVVLKHLQNKRHKTFLDQWLLNEDLDGYAKPWKYARLNTVERILLAQRLENRSADIVRNVLESYLIAPTPRQQLDSLYDTAILSLWMDSGRQAGRGLEPSMNLPKLSEAKKERFDADDDAKAGAKIVVRDSDSSSIVGDFAVDMEKDGLGQSNELEMLDVAAAPMAKQQSLSRMGRSGSGRKLVEEFRSGGEKSGAISEGVFGGMKPSSGMRAETRSRVVPVQKFLTEKKKRKLADGTIESYEVKVPYTENVTQNYTVQVPFSEESFGFYDSRKLDELRRSTRSLYRRIPPTQEWIENNYYELLPSQQLAELVNVNQFWRDYANHDGGSFLSPNFSEANRNFTEIMFALSVLDLPLKGPEHKMEYDDNKMTFTASGPTIAFHQQVEDAIVDRGNTTILVSENFFQKNDRYRHEDGVRFDKFISGDFHAHTLYGGQVVITNPTSTPRAVELLIQIPEGSVASSGSQETRTIQLDLQAFSTKTFEYSFYFPTAGKFSHYPAHVSSDEKVLAIADPVNFKVIDQPAEVDKTSWEFVSQNGTDDEVIEFLNQKNILRLDLDKIAFRMGDKTFFKRAIETLRNRYVYNQTLWSYSIKHDVTEAIREFLAHATQINSNCGPYFESELLTLDPIERDWYQHREYWPLVNARSHQLGPQRKILNPDFYSQYQQLMGVLAHRRDLASDDHLAVTYYMLLQDRVETALKHFALVKSDSINTELQYAYCDAYLDMYRAKPEDAAEKAAVYADYPVDHWRNRFKNILAQVEEIRGGDTETVDQKNQTQKQTELASQSESFDFEVESDTVKVVYQNVSEIQVNYYEMDIELLFSRSPFAQDELDGFSMIRPNVTKTMKLQKSAGEKENKAGSKGEHEFQIPGELKNKNILVEIVAGDQAKSQPFFANSLNVQTVENYGQLHVTEASKSTAIPKTYVKVYARMNDGSVRFHKDGYTDLRGRFDYVSQSNNSIDGIQKLSVLVLSEEHGAIIRQVNPPRE